MTVKELITMLLDYPMDSHIYRDSYGSLSALQERDITQDKDNDLIIGD